MTDTRAPRRVLRWRVVDIVIAAVLGVACGLIFFLWNYTGYFAFLAVDALTPGLGGLLAGPWLLGGVIGGLVIRKPGAALFVELLAAIVSALLGNVWGIGTLYSGIAQGLGAELVFAAFAYRRFGIAPAVLAGAVSAIGAFVLELFTSGNLARTLEFNLIYLTSLTLSGTVLAGVLGWVIMRALAAAGVLDRFAAGREYRERSS